MGIMDMFTTKQPVQQSQQQVDPNKQVQDPNKQADPNKQVQDANKLENQKNPLDIYSGLYDNANRKDAITAPSFKLDPAKIKEVAGTMDFTKNVDPDLLAKAQNGDTTALLQLINSVGRNSYAASVEHLTALTDHHLTSRSSFEDSRISDTVKKNLTANELSSTPNFSHPVLKTELNRIANQLSQLPENADATPQQIAKQAQEYLTNLANAMNPDKATGDKDQRFDPKTGKPVAQKEDFDWSQYLGEESSSQAT